MTLVIDQRVNMSDVVLDKVDWKRIQRLKNNSVQWENGEWYVYAGTTEASIGETMMSLCALFKALNISFYPSVRIATGTDRYGRTVDEQMILRALRKPRTRKERKRRRSYKEHTVLLTEKAGGLLAPLTHIKLTGPLAWIINRLDPRYVHDYSTDEGFFSYAVSFSCEKDEEELQTLLRLLGMEKGEPIWWPGCTCNDKEVCLEHDGDDDRKKMGV